MIRDWLGNGLTMARERLEEVGQKAKSNLAIIDEGREKTGILSRENKQRNKTNKHSKRCTRHG